MKKLFELIDDEIPSSAIRWYSNFILISVVILGYYYFTNLRIDKRFKKKGIWEEIIFVISIKYFRIFKSFKIIFR